MKPSGSISDRARLGLWSASVLAALALAVSSSESIDATKISGWTEINKKWPLDESEFFVTVKKRHHYIEVKLPPELSEEINIRLEYYYSFHKVRPTFEFINGVTRIDILEGRDADLGPEKWHEHNIVVDKSSYKPRNEIAYNVLLHDEKDVFAWRVIELNSKSTPVTRAPEIVESSSESVTHQTIQDETTTQQPTSDQPTTQSIGGNDQPTTQSSGGNYDTTTQWNGKGYQTTPASGSDQTTTQDDRNQPTTQSSGGYYQTTTQSSGGDYQTTTQSSSENYGRNDQNDQTTTQSYGESDRPGSPPHDQDYSPGHSYNLRKKRNPLNKGPLNRFRRWIAGESVDFHLTCRPSSCDRSRFHFSKWFLVLAKGVPTGSAAVLASGGELRFSTNNEPLNFLIESEEDLSNVDTCVNLTLFMDADTKMDFLIEDESSPTKSKLLEKIERKMLDSGAGKWEQFTRCITDYMPKLSTVGPDAHKLRLTFVPKPGPPGKRLAVLSQKNSTFLKVRYSPHDYLQNILNPELKVDQQVLEKFWVLDEDGLRKPQFSLETIFPEESTSEGATQQRVLRVTNIDPKQESFDLTSRWVKIQDLDKLQSPATFNYQADPADWIKSVDFEYQSAASNSWISHADLIVRDTIDTTTAAPGAISTEPNGPSTEPPSSSASSTPDEDSSGTSTTESSSGQPTTDAASSTPSYPRATLGRSPQDPISLPILIKGLQSDEFRVRIKHYLTDEARQSDEPRNLTIRTLALADACAGVQMPLYCQNKGKCRPTGTSTAECECLQGYSGAHCEEVRPCEVLYGDKTGAALCQQMGATCIENIPTLRCKWSDDQPSGPVANAVEQACCDEERRNIIILSVFSLALLLFSVIIVINLVKRLMESKRRLKRAESEAHEMARRAQPGTSGAVFGRPQTGRNKPPVSISYNNQAFDAD